MGAETEGAEKRNAEGVKWVRNGEGYTLPHRLGSLGSVVSSPSGVQGGAPAEKDLLCFLP